MMGDLNSLSKLDSKSYDESKLLKHIRGMRVKDTKDRLTKKFLKPSLNFREKYTIDYGAIEMFLNFGYVDFLGEANLKSKSFHHTVPTMLQVDYMHAQRMRLDYIIGNREFSKKYGSCVNAHTMQSACSEILSDHLPILLTFKTNIGGNGGRSANNKKETLLKKIRCDEHRKMENQLKSCSWKTLCKWKEDWKRMKQMLEVERQNLCAANECNQRKWDGEERGQNRQYPMGA